MASTFSLPKRFLNLKSSSINENNFRLKEEKIQGHKP